MNRSKSETAAGYIVPAKDIGRCSECRYFWIALFFFGSSNYGYIESILNSFFGKFLVIGITWSFSFQILSEIRHLFWDMGYGFELTTSKISGIIVIFGSFVVTILIYILGRQLI